MKEEVKTNVNFNSIIDYVPYAVNVDVEAMRSEYLPGESARLGSQQLWFYQVNKKEVQALVQELYFSNNTENEGNTTENSSETSNENTNTSNTTEAITEEQTNNLAILAMTQRLLKLKFVGCFT